MSIEEQANGRWKVTVNVCAASGARRRVCRTYDTEAEAERQHELLARKPSDAHGRTVLDAVDRYLSIAGRELAPNTENTYRSTRDVYLAESWLGGRRLDQLESDDLTRFYSQVFDGSWRKGAPKVATSTVRKIHRLISVSLGDAPRSWIERNIARDVKVRGPKPKPSAADDYDLFDVARVLDAAHTDRDGKPAPDTGRDLTDLVQLAIATSAREGELAALRWRDIELGEGVITFHGSVSQRRRADGGGWHRKSTKTGRPRAMRIDDATTAMLAARYQRQAAQAERDGIDPDDLDRRAVLSLELELDLTSPSALGARWRRAADKAGIALRFHDLRHVSASEMSAAGVPVATATKRTGHSSDRMYFDTYGHHRADTDDLATAALGDTWQRIDAARGRKAKR